MAKNDFFLSFGTDADVFASKIETESGRASKAILHLTQALEDYDGTVKNAKAGGPLQNLFASLDDAASKFGSLSNQLVQGFNKTLEGVGELTGELAGLVDAVNKINELTPNKKRKVAEHINNVTNDDVVATDNARRAGKALGDVIELNATAARNALKRVADINATVGRNSNDAANGVKELAKQIRELSGAAKEAKGRGTVGQIGSGGGGSIIVVANGGVVAGAAGAPVNLQALVDDALRAASNSTTKVADGPLPTDQAADALVLRRSKKVVPLDDLNAPARPGKYAHPEVADSSGRQGRVVGNDIRPGESFQQYFARNDATRAVINTARENLPQPNRDDLALYRRFKESGGSQANQIFERELTKGTGLGPYEQVKASFEGVKYGSFNPGNKNADLIPQLLTRLAPIRAQQEKLSQEAIEHLLSLDPYTTFGGGAFGKQDLDKELGNTLPAALHRVDERIVDRGVENRAVSTDQAGNILDASLKGAELRASSRTPIFRDVAAVDPSRLVDANTVATEEQEGLTAKGVAKDNARRRKEARDRNKALIDSLDAIDPEAVRARRKANPELQRINDSLSKKSLNTGEIAEALGLKSESYRVPATDAGKFERQALLREQAQTQLEALKVDPAKYAARSGLAPEALAAQLQATITGATASIKEQTTRSRILGVTDDSEGQARAVLTARRAAILAETAAAAAKPGPLAGPEDANYRTVYRGSREPLDPKRITPEGLRVTQDRSYAEEHGGDQYLYKAQIPASHFRVSEFTDEEEQHARLSAEDFSKYKFEQVVGPEAANTGTPKKVRQPRNKGALVQARELLKDLTEQVAASSQEDQALLGSLAAAQEEVDRLSQARAPKAQAAGGGGAGTPPKPPKPPNAGSAGTPDPGEGGGLFDDDLSKKKNRSTAGLFTRDFSSQVALLQESTKAQLADYAARLKDTQAIADQTQKIAAQRQILLEAGAAFKNDPLFKKIPDLTTKKGTFAEALGIPGSTRNNATITQLFTQGGALSASGLTNLATSAAKAPGRVAGAGDEGGTLGTALFGKRGFIDSQLRHVGSAIENFAGFQLVFTGFEKLKELVDTGIQADAVFVRLKQNLEATGRDTTQIRSQLLGVSSKTATSIVSTQESAAELTGVFHNNNDLVVGTQVVNQLSLISQGTLTAKEAAIALRDVTDAYGISGSSAIKAVGDQIARVSQLTGVSVKDIAEGSTDLAQEAKQFKLPQRTTAVLAAEITKNTGEKGAGAAEQLSRIFSTLNDPKVREVLIRQGIGTQKQFGEGKLGDIITSLIENFDKTSEAGQQEIFKAVGSGRQARAFTGILRDAGETAQFLKEDPSKDKGALEESANRTLATLAGLMRETENDFKLLGVTLAQAGVFNILGAGLKVLDEFFKRFNQVFGGINKFFNENPLLKGIRDMTVAILELGLAFKVLGGPAGSLLGRISPNRARIATDTGLAATRLSAAQVQAGIANGTITAEQAAAGAVYRTGVVGSTATRVIGTEATAFAPVTPRGVLTGARGVPGRVGNFFTAPAGLLSPIGNATDEAARAARREVVSAGRAAALEAQAAGGGRIRQGRAALAANFRNAQFLEEGLHGVPATGIVDRGLVNTKAGFSALNQSLRESATGAGRLGTNIGGLNAAMIGLAVAIPLIINEVNTVRGRGKNRDKARDNLLTDTDAVDTRTAKQVAQDEAQASTSKVSFLDVALRNTFSNSAPGQLINGVTNLITGHDLVSQDSQGFTSDESDKAESKITNSAFTKLRAAVNDKSGTAKEQQDRIKKAQDEINADIDKNAKAAAEAGGNDANAQTSIYNELAFLKSKIAEAGSRRLAILDGLTQVDLLTEDQITQADNVAKTTIGLTSATLTKYQDLIKTLNENTGAGGQVGADLAAIANPNATQGDRLRSLRDQKNTEISLESAQLAGGNFGKPVDQSYRDEVAKIVAKLAEVSALDGQISQADTALNTASSQTNLSQGRTTEGVAGLRNQKDSLEKYLGTLSKTQPEYYATLAAIQQVQIDIVNAVNRQDIADLNTKIAGEADPVQRAKDALTVAQKQLAAARAGATARAKTAADVDPNSAEGREIDAAKAAKAIADGNLAGAKNDYAAGIAAGDSPSERHAGIQAAEIAADDAKKRLTAAYAAAGLDPNGKAVSVKDAAAGQKKARTDETAAEKAVTDAQTAVDNFKEPAPGFIGPTATRDQLVKGLEDAKTKLTAAKNAVTLADVLSDAVNQAQAAEAAAALAVEQAKEGQKAAENAAAYAGTLSRTTQVNAKIAENTRQQLVYSKGALKDLTRLAQLKGEAKDLTLQQAQLDQEFTRTQQDLAIATLNARGGLGDSAAAANIQVTQATDALANFKKNGGTEKDPEYNTLQAAIVTARRNAFDVALNAQLDTLDFQKETYKITSSQEVQALQEILKNKQLTLAEQRSITLKIKSLQDSVRQQLTGGGFNIPTDIKLPTAFQVRRSLGGGFGNGGNNTTVNNTATNSVAITNNVPTAAVAQQIANQVIAVINAQTGQSARANTSTPRLVGP